MEIVRVFNNNLVLALDDRGREVILTGRGLGFQARPGSAPILSASSAYSPRSMDATPTIWPNCSPAFRPSTSS